VPSSTALSALPASATLPKDAAVVESSAGRKFRVTRNAAQVYYWEYVGSQVSHGFPAYSYTAPTSGDSIPGSNPYTYFMVEAEQPTVGLYWQSAPDSGYSVDNLPPGAPAIIAAAYQTGATHLHWSPNSESDFSLYRIYRGNSAGFVPGTGNLIASQPDTGYADSGPAGSYYKISAVDIHGNESAFTLLTPAQTSGVGPPPAPGALALAPPWPNPARERALLSFAVPAAGPVTLAVYDLGGRRVRTLAQGPLAAGEYEVRFDLRDGAGRTVPRGLYFVRLEAGGRTLVRRLAIVQ
jgi:hypothetical protein